ncbi:MAG: hypothetical protein V1800_07320 [Candidatus Latescibacterota bacterium]
MTTEHIKKMTEAEFMVSLGPGEPLEILEARHDDDVARAIAHKNQPIEGMTRIRIVLGRPPKGEEAPVQVKAVRMPESFWANFQAQAQAAGLTLHAAMRSALIEWASRHSH